MAISNDPQAVDTREFKRVQAAKLVHHLASNKRGRAVRGTREFTFARQAEVRHIGKDLEEAVELLCDHHLSRIRLQIKRTKKIPRAAPGAMAVRRRRNTQDARV
ncbi:hypothetical protein V1278_001874 [Bradyrhizobium sp. AZCC 1577]